MKIKIIAFFLCLNFSTSAFALYEDSIGPYPARGSAAEAYDFLVLLSFQASRTQAQCAEAQLESDASLKVFFGDLLSPSELDKAKSKLRWITVKSGAIILALKTKYNRPRPYDYRADIKPCIDLEGTKAYPSGHTTLGRIYGRILSTMHPERADMFMKRAEEVAFHRVLGGVHHPSDIVAGNKLGDAIAEDYLNFSDSLLED